MGGLISTLWLAPRETVSFVLPRPSKFPEAKPRETLRPRGNETRYFLRGLSLIKCFVSPSPSPLLKSRKNYEDFVCFTPAGSEICRSLKEHDLITRESKVPWELVRFVRPRELVSFDPRHVVSVPPIRKRIWVGRYNENAYPPQRVVEKWILVKGRQVTGSASLMCCCLVTF